MDFRIWSYVDQIALENLEIHLQNWQQFLDTYEGQLGHSSAPKALQASLRRHLACALHTRALLDQQRLLLLRLQQPEAKAHPFPSTGTGGDGVVE